MFPATLGQRAANSGNLGKNKKTNILFFLLPLHGSILTSKLMLEEAKPVGSPESDGWVLPPPQSARGRVAGASAHKDTNTMPSETGDPNV